MSEILDLFPLERGLFPYQILPLKIFESRYLSLVDKCWKENLPFGITLIQEGREVGPPAIPHSIGTLATIQDYEQLLSNFYTITVRGDRRFRIQRLLQEQPHIRVEIEWIDEPSPSFPGDYALLRTSLIQVMKKYSPFLSEKILSSFPTEDRKLLGLVGQMLSSFPKNKQTFLDLPGEKIVPALLDFFESLL